MSTYCVFVQVSMSMSHAAMWRTEVNIWESVLSLYCELEVQVVRLDAKCFLPIEPPHWPKSNFYIIFCSNSKLFPKEHKLHFKKQLTIKSMYHVCLKSI